MKLDDPKLTAFALGELLPAERQAVEAELAAHPEFVAEVEETQEMAGILRNGLRGEPAGELAAHQRDAIFRAARVTQPVAVPANEQPATHVLSETKWWDRPRPWQAIAACAVVSLGIYATGVNVSKPSPKEEMVTTGEISAPTNAAVAEKPEVEVGTFAGNSTPTKRGPHVIGVRNQELTNALAGADVARNANRPTVSDTLIADWVKVLIKEAGRAKAGSDYANFAQVFRPVAGEAGRYEMIRCPSIKVDVEFAGADGQPLTAPPTPESRIKKVSKPYLETE